MYWAKRPEAGALVVPLALESYRPARLMVSKYIFDMYSWEMSVRVTGVLVMPALVTSSKGEPAKGLFVAASRLRSFSR